MIKRGLARPRPSPRWRSRDRARRSSLEQRPGALASVRQGHDGLSVRDDPPAAPRLAVADGAVRQGGGQLPVLVLETLIDSANPQQLAGIMASLGFSSGLPPIAGRVPADKRLSSKPRSPRPTLPRPVFDRMETWAAAFTLLGTQFQMLGVEGEQGVEAVLRKSFADAGKPVGQLETNTEQLDLLRSPARNRPALASRRLNREPGRRCGRSSMACSAWLSGDVNAIGNSFNHDLQSSPELKAALLTPPQLELEPVDRTADDPARHRHGRRRRRPSRRQRPFSATCRAAATR